MEEPLLFRLLPSAMDLWYVTFIFWTDNFLIAFVVVIFMRKKYSQIIIKVTSITT